MNYIDELDIPSEYWPKCIECGRPAFESATGLCGHCQSKHNSKKRRELIVELGIEDVNPSTELTLNFTTEAPALELSKYMLGKRQWTADWPPPWPYFRLGPCVSQVWYERVNVKGLVAYAEARWHPEHGRRISTHRLETVSSVADEAALQQAILVLHAFDGTQASNIGRPRNSGYFASREEFHNAYLQSRLRFMHDGVDHPNADQMADSLCMSKSALMANQKKWGKP